MCNSGRLATPVRRQIASRSTEGDIRSFEGDSRASVGDRRLIESDSRINQGYGRAIESDLTEEAHSGQSRATLVQFLVP